MATITTHGYIFAGVVSLTNSGDVRATITGVLSSVRAGPPVDATASATLLADTVSYISPGVTGTGYTTPPTVVLTGGGGTGATAIALIDLLTGGVIGYLVTNGGSGYTSEPLVTLVGGRPSASVGGISISSTASTSAASSSGLGGPSGSQDPQGNKVPSANRPYPGSSQVAAATSQLSLSSIASCGTCPAYVIQALNRDVAEMSGAITEAKFLSDIINRAIRGLTSELVTVMNAFIDTIPSPPLFDIRELVGFWTCPLTPQALVNDNLQAAMAAAHRKGTEATGGVGSIAIVPYMPVAYTEFNKQILRQSALLAKGDPRPYLRAIARMIKDMVESFWKRFEDFLTKAGAAVKNAVKTLLRLVSDLFRIIRDLPYFLIRLTVAKGNAALVKATCPNVYNSPQYSFKAFDENVRGWGIKGFLPSDISADAQPFMEVGTRLTMKIAQWQVASLILLV